MSRATVHKKTGFVEFHRTPEEKLLVETLEENKKLKKENKKLAKDIAEIKEALGLNKEAKNDK